MPKEVKAPKLNAEQKLVLDRQMCAEEINPILQKYNLMLVPGLTIELHRPQGKK